MSKLADRLEALIARSEDPDIDPHTRAEAKDHLSMLMDSVVLQLPALLRALEMGSGETCDCALCTAYRAIEEAAE